MIQRVPFTVSNENFLDSAFYHIAADAASIRISRALECFLHEPMPRFGPGNQLSKDQNPKLHCGVIAQLTD